jgi:diguanylate cyclase (GGDEF)-like protein
MSDNPYAGVDRDLARRMAGAFWLIGAVLASAVLPLSPPTDAIGDAGWAVAGASALISLAGAAVLLRRARMPYAVLLLGGYLGLAQIAVAQWLAGGLEAPYWQLFILPALQIAAVHPARRVVPFFAVLLAAAAAPLVYEGWRAETAATLVLGALLWVGVALITYRLMAELRRKRVEARREQDHAKRLARLDPLTGLSNRRAFDEAIDDQVAMARATGRPLSVLLADVDSFKQINDEFGHVNGDSCLRQVARTIQATVRATDACFRWGGDEFVVLLPDTGPERAAELGERLSTAVHAACRDPEGLPLGVSCGHTQLADGMAGEQLVEAADLELLALKRSLTR